jgi:hypothetical protein
MVCKRAFSTVICAYSSFGMVKLSRSIFTLGCLTFLSAGAAFLAGFFAVFVAVDLAIAFAGALGFAAAVAVGLVVAVDFAAGAGLATGAAFGASAGVFGKPSASASMGDTLVMAGSFQKTV